MNFKFLVPIILSILIGFLFGKVIFNNYTDKVESVFNDDKTAYFIQYGAFVSKEKMKEATLTLSKYVYDYDNEYYRVYIGITMNKSNIDKIKGIYKNVSNDIYVKENSINNKFTNYLINSDKLLESTNDDTVIKNIVIENLKQYEESNSE